MKPVTFVCGWQLWRNNLQVRLSAGPVSTNSL
jgi:hypothetical protein